MLSYQAPNPYPQPSKSFFATLFTWSSPSLMESSSESIGKIILPAQSRLPQIITQGNILDIEHHYGVKIDGGFITTHDAAELDTIEITPEQTLETPIHQKRFVIKFNGNGGQYQDLIDMYAEDANTLGYTVIGFNFRGVGESKKTPTVFQDLITDGIAEVQRLIDNGVNPENILLDGHSLGGGVATKVAEHFHGLKARVSLWNDRSFATLTKAAAGILAPTLPGILDDAVQTSFASTTWSVLESTGWNVDAASAYKRIPGKYKSYIVVDNTQSRDGVISQQASLDETVKKDEQRKNMITGHSVLAPHFFNGGHNLRRKDLISEKDPNQTAQDLYIDFARKLGH